MNWKKKLLLAVFLACLGPAMVQAEEIVGKLSVFYSDPVTKTGMLDKTRAPTRIFSLFSEDRKVNLSLSPEQQGKALNLVGKNVKVTIDDSLAAKGPVRFLPAESLEEVEDDGIFQADLPEASQIKNLGVLEVTFADDPFVTPQTRLNTVFTSSAAPYLINQVEELSYGKYQLQTTIINISLPTKSKYDFNGSQWFDTFSQDVADAAAAKGVQLGSFDTLVFIPNCLIGNSAVSVRGMPLQINGSDVFFDVSWISAQWIFQTTITNVWILTHEVVGHLISKLHHTYAPDNALYHVGFDPMGGGGWAHYDPDFGSLPTRFNMAHSALVPGYIPSGKIHTSQPQTEQTITLACPDKTLSVAGYSALLFPAGTSSGKKNYVVAQAACRNDIYGINYPGANEGIIFYYFEGSTENVWFINPDLDGNGNSSPIYYNDDGSYATVGQEFSLSSTNAGNATVKVLSRTSNSFSVKVTNNNPVEQVALTISIKSDQAASEGGQGSVDGGSWMTGMTYVTPGTHTITFRDITGWKTPATQTVEVASAMTVTGTYTRLEQPNPVQSEKVYGAFGAGGLWMYDGSSWSQLAAASPKAMVASGSAFYGAFGTGGLWMYNNGWSGLTAASPEVMAAFKKTLFASFSAYGLYRYDIGYGWSQMASASPVTMALSGSTLYASFTDYGLWAHNDSWGWSQVSWAKPYALAASESVLCLALSGYGADDGVWMYNGYWNHLTTAQPYAMAVSGQKLYIAISGYGVWLYDNGWVHLTGTNPYSLVVSGDNMYGAFGASGIWKYNGSWSQLTAGAAGVVAAE